MIATLTLNPAIDFPMAFDALRLGETNRGGSSGFDPGGKGVNASRVIHRLGGPTIAYGFSGGVVGALLCTRLDDEQVSHAFEEIEGTTRMNVMLYERETQRRTRLLLDGPRIEPRHLDALLKRLGEIPRGGTAVLGGSIPPGLPMTIYRDLVSWLNQRGVRCIVDASGSALAHVLAAHPALIKPNVEEAGEVLARALDGDAAVLEAAVELQRRGANAVVISQGAAGAIGVSEEGAWKAIAPKIEVRSTVGSGDSMVGGIAFALDRGASFAQALRMGTAAGTATAMAPQRHLCRAEDVKRLLPHVVMRECASTTRSA
ncbi:MAG TPA: 1-phosphofructokinase [Candidatus Tyrphobacter sp.]